MKKSGLADSPFFVPQENSEVTSPQAETSPMEVKTSTADKTLVQTPPSPEPAGTKDPKISASKKADITNETTNTPTQSEKKDVMKASMQASNNASMHASNQPLIHETIIETIRKAVKDVGKDSATYRFTPEEKRALLELGFSFKMQGYKTSENELTRIAINFLLEDQKQNGKNSVLQRVLDALDK